MLSDRPEGLDGGGKRRTPLPVAMVLSPSRSPDLRGLLSCGVYWSGNSAKYSCGSPPSVNMEPASQIVPLVDGGFEPKTPLSYPGNTGLYGGRLERSTGGSK